MDSAAMDGTTLLAAAAMGGQFELVFALVHGGAIIAATPPPPPAPHAPTLAAARAVMEAEEARGDGPGDGRESPVALPALDGSEAGVDGDGGSGDEADMAADERQRSFEEDAASGTDGVTTRPLLKSRCAVCNRVAYYQVCVCVCVFVCVFACVCVCVSFRAIFARNNLDPPFFFRLTSAVLAVSVDLLLRANPPAKGVVRGPPQRVPARRWERQARRGTQGGVFFFGSRTVVCLFCPPPLFRLCCSF